MRDGRKLTAVRLSDAEWQQLQDLAELLKKSKSAVMRDLIARSHKQRIKK